MKFLCIFVLACLLEGAVSQAVRNSVCPPYSPASGFKQAALNGRWYIHQQVPWTETISITCANFLFSRGPFKLNLGGYFIGTSNDVSRAITVSDKGNGRFSMTIQGANVDVTVVASDSRNYLALYSCINTDKNLSIEFGWVLTRSGTVSGRDIDLARSGLERAGLKSSLLKTMSQSNCRQ